jgi:uncharacterized protein
MILSRVFLALRFARPVLLAALAWAAFSSAPAAAETRGKIKIAFIGDSTADGLWGGVTSFVSQQKCLKDVFEFGRFAKNSTGLTRIDRFNWAEEAGKVAGAFKPDLVIISMGLNDRQSIVEPAAGGRRITMWESADWPVRYKYHVGEVLKRAASGTAQVLWVGLAAMRDSATDKDVRQKNQIFLEAATEWAGSNVHFIPPWRLKEEGDDVFASYAKNKDGRMINIRMPDGEHFTSAGDELVAAYLLPKIVANLRASGMEINVSCVIASG